LVPEPMIPVDDSINLSNHKNLENKIGTIADKIRTQGEKRRALSELIRNVKKDVEVPDDEERGPVESKLVYPVEDRSLEDLKVAGVDGGVLTKPLHGLDLILVRAVVTMFQYEDGDLKDVDYHPSEVPAPQLVNVHEPLDSKELDLLTGLKRQLTELQRAYEVLKEVDLDVMVLDGSIVPQYIHKASKERTKELYEKVIETYGKIYKTATRNEVLLIGAVEDSRSTRLTSIFEEDIFPEILENADLSEKDRFKFNENKDVVMESRDTAFLDYLLGAGERSFTFKYSKAPSSLLSDLHPWAKRVRAFYMKPVEYDRPTRVEFLTNPKNPKKTIERTASLVNSLSASHDACALPSVLIEADARASLSQEEITILRDNIADQLEPSTMMDLRRDRRPFK